MSFPFWSGNQAEQDRLQYALQAAQIGTWNLDVSRQQVWWDERCQELYGLRGQDVVSYQQLLASIYEDDRPRMEQAIQAALEPSSTGYYDVQFRTSTTQTVDGQPRWLHAQGRAYVDVRGAAYRLSGVVRDITAQVQTRQQLEISKARFRSLVANSPTATVLFVGPQIVIDSVNKPMLRIWGKDESVMGQPVHEVMPELAGQPFLDLLRRVYDTGESYHQAETRARVVVEGQWQESWFNFAYNPVYAPDGSIYGVLNTATDVTAQVVALRASEQRYRRLSEELEQRVNQRTQELNLANQDLKRSNENLQQFAYIASHDLQEPLRKIQSFGDLVLRQTAAPLDDQSRFMLQRMVEAGNRMSALVNDLLTFSRVKTRQEAFKQVSLQKIMARVLDTLDLAIEQTGASIHLQALPRVNGDEMQLGQLFQNLLSNSLKFAAGDRTPVISITVGEQERATLPPDVVPSGHAERFHRIGVVDNGIGFDTKYLDRIFQVFQRLHGKNQYTGTGIGLAICQRVVENHGGAITAQSQPGQGSTFIVYLPVP
ncbi:Phytochrome-like protein cph1 [Fibrella aestuarina BUZ 2]|uniref:histidine kinase n=1 Tax=Fibrella aestuarina BUZ 2 TaxID=1166018 RepID=I0KAE2_9BACT|nr:ATP-binding protein [Fibrella aestuarina]CCH01095.1 Phytochrome-like protein cph1 [Fibrella aestuarina BUZ 2]